ncbi:MAG TPA: FG-GAP-like repeat-containing protein [Bryobacteraceae bacterium]|nr:FG-GAP-like repeat-containing protein [Bryobacteraceae bacterium]
MRVTLPQTLRSPVQFPYIVEIEPISEEVSVGGGLVVFQDSTTKFEVVEKVNGHTHINHEPFDPETALAVAQQLCNSTVQSSGGFGGFARHAAATAAAALPWGQASQSLIAADFNGDGIPDTVVLNSGSATVTLLNADGTVKSTSTLSVANSSPYGLAADFNGDGYQDLAITNNPQGSPTGSISIFLGKGDGTFQAPKQFPVAGYPFSIAAADFNGDGYLDVAVTDDVLGLVWVLSGDGHGNLGTPVSYPTGSQTPYNLNPPTSLVAQDFTGDGKIDLAIFNNNAIAVTVAVLPNLGNGTFGAPKLSPGGLSRGGYLSYGDFNRDGKLDLAIAIANADSIAMLMGNGDGTFAAPVNYVTGDIPASLSPLPNDDGTFELLTLDHNTQQMIVTPGLSDGELNVPLLYAAGQRPVSVAAGDMNGDGIPDIVTYNNNCCQAGVSVLLTKPDFTEQAAVAYPLASAGAQTPQALALGDLNGDKIPDVVVTGSQSASGTVSVLLGQKAGTLGGEHDFPSGSFPTAVVMADFNGDHNLDLAVANGGDTNNPAETGNVSILFGNGDGSFKAPVNYNVGPLRPMSLVAADLNGDGMPDLAVATGSPSFTNPAPGAVTILLNNGKGVFTSAGTIPAGPSAGQNLALAVGDLNGDKFNDLAILNYNPSTFANNVAIYFNNHSGGFTAGPVFASTQPETLAFLALTDLNSDGNPDLILSGGAYATYALGNGDGTFQAEQDLYFAGSAPDAVALTDINGDHRPDLVFADSPGFVVVLANGFPAVTILSSANPDAEALAPGGLATAYGNDLAVGNPGATSLPLPSNFGGTTVSILDSSGVTTLAPLLYVGAKQVNFLVPTGVAAGAATITITSKDGTQSAAVVQIVPVAPGLFELNAVGLAAAYVIVYHPDGSSTSEPLYRLDNTGAIVAAPVSLGSAGDIPYLFLFGTGLQAAGTAGVTVKVGGVNCTVSYAGTQGGFAGLDQVNVLLPQSLKGAGAVNINLIAGGIPANTLNMTIQ